MEYRESKPSFIKFVVIDFVFCMTHMWIHVCVIPEKKMRFHNVCVNFTYVKIVNFFL